MKLGSQLCNPRNQESAVDYVFNAVISAITNRELAPGDKLPTESELSQNLGVGRNSVREAIKKLEAYGIVQIQRAEGTFICQEYNQKMLDPLLYGILLRADSWDNFAQLRSALEIGTLYLACETATVQDIEELKKITDILKQQLEQEFPNIDDILNTDRRFHTQIAAITGNKMILDFIEYISQITLRSRKATLQSVLQKKTTTDFLQKHLALLNVIQNHSYADIKNAVFSHYENWESF